MLTTIGVMLMAALGIALMFVIALLILMLTDDE